jgi:CheY-like chemotaxis protein
MWFMTKLCDNHFEMLKPILLAEDFEPDAAAIQTAFKKRGVINPIFVVSDGAEAIAYLKGEGIYDNRVKFPLPGMLLLDLKMPKRNGLEVLEWCKTQAYLSDLLIIVLSAHHEIKEVTRAYELGANTFLIKPVSEDDVANLAEKFREYWGS